MAVARIWALPAPDGNIEKVDRTLVVSGFETTLIAIQKDPLWRRRNDASGTWKEQDEVTGDWTKN